MRIVRVIQARRVAGASGRVDPERADLPVAGDGTHHEENDDQAGEEEEESKLPPPPTVRFATRARLDGDWLGREGGDRGAVRDERNHGFHFGADRRRGEDGFRRHCRHSRAGDLDWGFGLGRHRLDRRARRASRARQFLQLCPGGADGRRNDLGSRDVTLNGRRRQPGKPLLQLRPVRWILWLGSTPRWEAHLGPTLAPSDYGPYFARGRSAMPL